MHANRAVTTSPTGERASSGLRPVLLLLLSGLTCGGCRAAHPGAAPGPSASELRSIDRTLDELYRSFCFEAGGDADWGAMRALFLDGASFVAPVRDGVTASAVGAEAFVEDFREWIATSPEGRSGLHERIEHRRVDLFGHVAHAYVLFEGFVPGEEQARTRGIDSIQLVRDGDRWLVASFTTQYATDDQQIPKRFEAP